MYGSNILTFLILTQFMLSVLPNGTETHYRYERQSGGQPVVTNTKPSQAEPPTGNNPNQGQGAGAGAGTGGQNGGRGIAAMSDPEKTIDTRGTEFIFCFTSNVGNARPQALKVMIGAGGPDFTAVDVSVPFYKFFRQFIIEQGEVEVIDIPPRAAAFGSGPQNGTVWVRANRPVTVHGISIQQKSHDGFLVIPAFGLGLEYYVMSYPARGNERSQFLITGVQDFTRLQIHPIQRLLFKGKWFNIGDTILLQINRLQSVQIQTPGDLTGTRILSDYPISVMSGATCSLVPANLNRCDHLVENLPPVATWGKRFSVVPFRNRTTGHVLRVMAARPNTRFATLGQVFMLQRGGLFREFNQPVAFPMSIVSDKPLLVVQFAKGGALDKTGDPFMTVIPPVEQYVAGSVTFSTFDQSGKDKFRSFAAVSVTSWDLLNVFINNEALLTHSYKNPQRGDWMRLQTLDATYVKELEKGANTLACPTPLSRFSAIIYGFTEGTSYAFPAVYGLRRLLCTSGKGGTESDCTGPIVSGIILSDTHETGVGIQTPPDAPIVPGQPKPPGAGLDNKPGWGNFNPSKTGTAWDGEGGGDAGVLFPWYTIPPWQADRWAEEQNDDEKVCYYPGLLVLSLIAPSFVVFTVMLIILIVLMFRKPEDSKF